MTRRSPFLSVVLFGGLLFSAIVSTTGAARAADWPMYRANAQRTGYTPEELPKDLTLKWVYKAAHPPRPAWPYLPKRRKKTNLDYDLVYQPIVSRGLVFFGSSADCKVYALDAATGKEKWTFFTEGPVRFAPAAWKDRLFVGSDDGYLYCLKAATGKLLWKKRGGPTDEKVLGNDRVVSRWPVRGGVVVLDDKVYFGAGIWPGDRAYVHALDAATGKELWCSNAGDIVTADAYASDGPHDKSIAFRGYLAAGGDRLVLPSGHTAPVAFQRSTGKLAYVERIRGCIAAVIVDSYLVTGERKRGFYDLKTGSAVMNGINPRSTTATPKWILWTSEGHLLGVERGKSFPTTGTGHRKRLAAKSLGVELRGDALIAAGSRLYAGGADQAGNGVVSAIDLQEKAIVWKAGVEGRIHGLAVADGRLYVATTKGFLYCFWGMGLQPKTIGPKRTEAPETNPVWSKAADEILKQSGVTEGWAVDLGCGDGSLTYELLKKSKLYVVAVEKDAAKVEQARRRLDAAGLYGVRAVVLQADPAKSGLPKWFANLVVSSRSVAGGEKSMPVAESSRIQRPYGGVVVLGKPGAMKKNVRGPLKAGGSWTHFWADAANSDCSGDSVLKGPLKSFWYRDSDLRMPHPTVPAPLFVNGRLYVTGADTIQAVDAYNGRVLWNFPHKLKFPNFAAEVVSAGFVCASADSLFVRDGAKILRIDGVTGKQQAAFKVPREYGGANGTWAYIAFDNGTLYASTAKFDTFDYMKKLKNISSPESAALIALDSKTGKAKWAYKAKNSIPNSSIVIGGGHVYFIDRAISAKGRLAYAASGKGAVVALNAADGKVVWKSAQEKIFPVLALSVERGVLVSSIYGNNKGTRRGKLCRSAIVSAFRTSDGKQLWSHGRVGPTSNPIMIGGTVYIQPRAVDLLTGKLKTAKGTEKPWTYYRTSHKSCGTVSASRNLLVFRSRALAWVDLTAGRGTEYYGGIRPGCRINAIPVGGLVLMPDFGACGCAYNWAWIALQGAE